MGSTGPFATAVHVELFPLISMGVQSTAKHSHLAVLGTPIEEKTEKTVPVQPPIRSTDEDWRGSRLHTTPLSLGTCLSMSSGDIIGARSYTFCL